MDVHPSVKEESDAGGLVKGPRREAQLACPSHDQHIPDTVRELKHTKRHTQTHTHTHTHTHTQLTLTPPYTHPGAPSLSPHAAHSASSPLLVGEEWSPARMQAPASGGGSSAGPSNTADSHWSKILLATTEDTFPGFTELPPCLPWSKVLYCAILPLTPKPPPMSQPQTLSPPQSPSTLPSPRPPANLKPSTGRLPSKP